MSDVKITVLPPGKAYGADDLRQWAGRRAAGYAGVHAAPTSKKGKAQAKAWAKVEKRLRKKGSGE
jgi:hypothetical protein